MAKCPICNSKLIGVVKLDEYKLQKFIERLKTSSLRSEDLEIKKMLEETCKLIQDYGKLAIIALASRLSIDKVREVLSKAKNLDELAKLIYMFEKEELKRRFFE